MDDIAKIKEILERIEARNIQLEHRIVETKQRICAILNNITRSLDEIFLLGLTQTSPATTAPFSDS